jgi:CheY-like chemotaxis protein
MWEICCNRLAPMRLGLTFQQVQKYEKGTNRRLQYGHGYGADDYMTKPFHKDELLSRHFKCMARVRIKF